MDVSGTSASMLQMAVNMAVLGKSMDSQEEGKMLLIHEMLNGPVGAPAAQLAPRAGSMDIYV